MNFKLFETVPNDGDNKLPKKGNDTTTVNETTPIVVTSAQVPSTTFVTPQSDGVFDEKMYNDLHQAMNSNPHAGTDYSDFAKTKKAMDSIAGMSDAAKYQAAFGTLKAITNLSKTLLLSTIDQYFSILDKEQASFNNAMASTVSSTVTLNQKAIETKTAEIQQKQVAIQKLNEEIVQRTTEINQLQNDVNTNQTKIDNAIKNFATTINVVKSELNTDKTNITNYLT